MKYQGTYSESFTVSAAADAVVAQFLDLDQVVALYGDLDSGDRIDDQTLQFMLTEQNHGVFTFKGRYDCRYEPVGTDGVKWSSVPVSNGDEANCDTQGHLSVKAGDDAGTCVLEYNATMTLDIDVNKMLAPMLKPIVEAAITKEMGEYVQRMIKAAEARA
ncbi:MAG: hypothetical protein AB8H79_24425 [Myxococcota bacterium]